MSDEGTSRGWLTILGTFQVSAVIGAAYYLAFELFRKYRNGKTPAYGGNLIVQERAGKGGLGGLPYRPTGWFGWVEPLRQVTHGDDLLELVGLDAYVLLRYLRLHIRLAAVSLLCGCIILMPTYESGNEDLDDPFFRTTMSNMEQGSWKFWIPTVVSLFYGVHSLWLIGKEYENFVRHRNEFMAHGAPEVSPQARYSIVVENVPSHLQSQALLRGYFDYLFPGLVHSAALGVEGAEISGLLDARDDIARRLETAYVQHQNYPEKRPVLVRPPYSDIDKCMMVYYGEEPIQNTVARYAQCCALCGCCGCGCCAAGKVEAIPYYEEVLRRLNQRTAEKQEQLRTEMKEVEVIGLSTIPSGGGGPSSPTSADSSDADVQPRKEGPVQPEEGFFSVLRRRWSNKSDEESKAVPKEDTPLQPKTLTAARFYAQEDPESCQRVKERTDGVCQRMSGTAFVTFKTLKAKQSAVQVLLSNESHMIAFPAAEPRDVLWHDIHQSYEGVQKNRFVASAAFTTLFVFFSIPVAACASASLDTLEVVFPFLSAFRGNYLYTTLGSFLPTVASLALLAIVPWLFKYSAENFEFFKSGQDVQIKVFERNYNLVLVYTYISLTAGSVFDALANVIESPFSIFRLLGTTVPGTAAYFINVIIVDTFQGAITELAQVQAHVIYWYFSRNGDDDLGPRDLELRDTPAAVDYGMTVPPFMLVALVAYLLELICPVIQAFACAYFFINYFVWKHQFLYVYERPAESGGNIVFFRMYKRTFTAIYVGQLTLIAYLLIKEAFGQAVFSIFPPMITFAVSRWYRKKYERPAEALSFEKAIFVDGEIHSGDLDDFEKDAYIQPALKDTEPAVAEQPRKYEAPQIPRRGSVSTERPSTATKNSGEA